MKKKQADRTRLQAEKLKIAAKKVKTTSAEEQKEVAALKAQLAQRAPAADELGVAQGAYAAAEGAAGGAAASKFAAFDPVELQEGVQKYVLISASDGDDQRWFVRGNCSAEYHKDAAQPTAYELQGAGLEVTITGGGRVKLDSDEKTIHVYGFSYGFGKADHSITQTCCT